MKTIERIYDATTGETIDIERDMTSQELADYEAAVAKAQARIAADNEKAAKREAALAKLAALGLEPDDLKALGL
jgi:hypothetical protein